MISLLSGILVDVRKPSRIGQMQDLCYRQSNSGASPSLLGRSKNEDGYLRLHSFPTMEKRRNRAV